MLKNCSRKPTVWYRGRLKAGSVPLGGGQRFAVAICGSGEVQAIERNGIRLLPAFAGPQPDQLYGIQRPMRGLPETPLNHHPAR